MSANDLVMSFGKLFRIGVSGGAQTTAGAQDCRCGMQGIERCPCTGVRQRNEKAPEQVQRILRW